MTKGRKLTVHRPGRTPRHVEVLSLDELVRDELKRQKNAQSKAASKQKRPK